MLKTNKLLYRIILIFNLIVIAAAAVVCLRVVVSPASNLFFRCSAICALLAIFSAGYYILQGYTKNAAGYYRLFVGLFALALLVDCVFSVVFTEDFEAMLLPGLAFVVVLLSFIGVDLGRTLSLILCGALVLISVGLLLTVLGQGSAAVELGAVRIALACLFGVMTYAKYLDKRARGTK